MRDKCWNFLDLKFWDISVKSFERFVLQFWGICIEIFINLCKVISNLCRSLGALTFKTLCQHIPMVMSSKTNNFTSSQPCEVHLTRMNYLLLLKCFQNPAYNKKILIKLSIRLRSCCWENTRLFCESINERWEVESLKGSKIMARTRSNNIKLERKTCGRGHSSLSHKIYYFWSKKKFGLIFDIIFCSTVSSWTS